MKHRGKCRLGGLLAAKQNGLPRERIGIAPLGRWLCRKANARWGSRHRSQGTRSPFERYSRSMARRVFFTGACDESERRLRPAHSVQLGTDSLALRSPQWKCIAAGIAGIPLATCCCEPGVGVITPRRGVDLAGMARLCQIHFPVCLFAPRRRRYDDEFDSIDSDVTKVVAHAAGPADRSLDSPVLRP
jgi:hypothetical protein